MAPQRTQTPFCSVFRPLLVRPGILKAAASSSVEFIGVGASKPRCEHEDTRPAKRFAVPLGRLPLLGEKGAAPWYCLELQQSAGEGECPLVSRDRHVGSIGGCVLE